MSGLPEAGPAAPTPHRKRPAFRARVLLAAVLAFLGSIVLFFGVTGTIVAPLFHYSDRSSFPRMSDRRWNYMETTIRVANLTVSIAALVAGSLSLGATVLWMRARWILALLLVALAIGLLVVAFPASEVVPDWILGPLPA